MNSLRQALVIVLASCLFCQCVRPRGQDLDRSVSTTSQQGSSELLTKDPDWTIRLTPTANGQKGLLAARCSNTGVCWYWNSSELWVFKGESVRKIPLKLSTREPLFDAYFLSPEIGWILSPVGLFQTSNSGAVWLRVPVPEFDNDRGRIHAVNFIDDKNGWIVGGVYESPLKNETMPNNAVSHDRTKVLIGTVARTENGGATWHLIPIKRSIGRFTDIMFSGQLGLISGDAGLQSSTDAGATWKDVSLGLSPQDMDERGQGNSTFILDQTRAWIVVSESELLITDDGAKSWRIIRLSQTLEDTAPPFSGIAFINATEGLGLIKGLGFGRLYKTNDAGKSWTRLNIDLSFSGIAMVPSSNQIIAVADSGVYSFRPKS